MKTVVLSSSQNCRVLEKRKKL